MVAARARGVGRRSRRICAEWPQLILYTIDVRTHCAISSRQCISAPCVGGHNTNSQTYACDTPSYGEIVWRWAVWAPYSACDAVIWSSAHGLCVISKEMRFSHVCCVCVCSRQSAEIFGIFIYIYTYKLGLCVCVCVCVIHGRMKRCANWTHTHWNGVTPWMARRLRAWLPDCTITRTEPVSISNI